MTWKCKIIKCQDYDSALEFVLNEDNMFPIILEGYRYLFNNNLLFIDLVEIRFGGIENLRIALDIQESEDTLNRLLTWLENQERYEECQEILNLRGTMS